MGDKHPDNKKAKNKKKRSKKSEKLPVRQQRYVDDFLISGNMTKAAEAAGYSKKTAPQQGSRLYKNVKVRAAIDAAMAARSKRTEISQDNVLKELAKLGFANMADYMTITDKGLAYIDLKKLTRDQAAAIQEITVDEYWDGTGDDAREVKRVKVKLSDKRASLELLGKHLGLFADTLKTPDIAKFLQVVIGEDEGEVESPTTPG